MSLDGQVPQSDDQFPDPPASAIHGDTDVQIYIEGQPHRHRVVYPLSTDRVWTLYDARAEQTPLAIVAVQGGVEVVAGCADFAREALGVDRRLGDAHSDVRARDEGGVPQQHHAPDREPWRLQVEYRLEEELLRALHDGGDLRREQAVRIGLDSSGHLRPDQGRRDRDAVAVAGDVGADITQRSAEVGGAVPDMVVAAVARAGPMRARVKT